MAIRTTMSAFGDLTRDLDRATKAIAALDGHLAEVSYDPYDAASIEMAIVTVDAAIDAKVGQYQNNPFVGSLIAQLKENQRTELLERAAQERLKRDGEGEGMESEAIYRRLNNAALDLSAATFQTYDEAIKKLSRLLHSPEIDPTTRKITSGIDIDAWLEQANETRKSMIGSSKLSWPADHQKELGTVILLIGRMAEKEGYATDIAHEYYNAVANNITMHLSNMTRQLIIPFVRDYIAYLKDQTPASVAAPAQPEPSHAPSVRAHPIHTIVVWTTFIAGLMLLALGAFALWWGSASDTEITILGNSFKSGSVGAVSIFLGVVLILFNFRRLLTSVERLTNAK